MIMFGNSRIFLPRAARLLTLTALLGLGVSTRGRADTFSVAAGDVNGLIAAINAANDQSNHPGPNTIVLTQSVYTLTQRNNALYGWTGLPLIASDVTIEGNGAIIERSNAQNTPSFRLFAVAGPDDLDPNTNLLVTTGNLKLFRCWLRGGRAQGGNGGSADDKYRGGGGMGAGGAIYNRGRLFVYQCTLSANTARGGDSGYFGNAYRSGAGGGGMGGDGGDTGQSGAGGGGMGGKGGNGCSNSNARLVFGGSGGGTVGNGSDGAINNVTVGGLFNGGYGMGANISGNITGNGGYGGGGGGDIQGSNGGGGGGGVGSEDAGGGDGGFGGGGGGVLGDGGFGGGGGGGVLAKGIYHVIGDPTTPHYLPFAYLIQIGFDGGAAGFGGAQGGERGGGGMGAGGALFNDGGSVSLFNSTFTGNTAQGGVTTHYDYSLYAGDYVDYTPPPFATALGAGGALFSRNGSVNINSVTFSANTAQGGLAGYFDSSRGPNGPGAGGAMYLLGDGAPVYIDGLQTATRHDMATNTVYSVSNSIFAGSTGGTSDAVVNAINGGAFTPVLAAGNLVQTNPAGQPTNGPVYFTDAYSGSALSGSAQAADPLLGPLQYNGGLTPTIAPAYNSPVIDAAYTGSAPLLDQRNFVRPQGAGPDIGAVEFQPTLRVILSDITVSRSTAGVVVVNFLLKNTGNVPVQNIKVAYARLGKLAPGSINDNFTLAPGATRGLAILFNNGKAGIPAGLTPFVVNGTYTGGTFSAGQNVNVPPIQ